MAEFNSIGKSMKALIAILLAFNITWAACELPVKYLSEGSIASCSGYLFSPEKETEVRIKINQFSTLEKLVIQQDALLLIQGQRLDLAQTQNLKLERIFEDRKDRDWYVNIAFFLGGAILTAVLATNVNR